MTGAFVRIERNGKFENIEFENLTEEEMKAFASKQPERGWQWAIALAKWIKENVKEEQ